MAAPTTAVPATVASTRPRYPAAFGVGIRTVTFVDPSRPTLDYADTPPQVLSPRRVLRTTIRYPTLEPGKGLLPGAPPATAFGPFPVVVFAHGFAVTPHTYEPLLDSWVRAGFVVVAPLFPVDNYYAWVAQGRGDASEADIWNEPEDLAVVVRDLVPLARQRGSFLNGLLDTSRVALAGQSDGANVVGALLFADSFAAVRATLPVRPRAALLLSGAEIGAGVPYQAASASLSVLSTESTTDYCNSTQDATTLYDAVAPGAAHHLFLVLDGATHLGPYDGAVPWFPVVRRVTTKFLEMALSVRHRPATLSTVQEVGERAGVATLLTSAAVSLPATGDTGDCGVSTPYP